MQRRKIAPITDENKKIAQLMISLLLEVRDDVTKLKQELDISCVDKGIAQSISREVLPTPTDRQLCEKFNEIHNECNDISPPDNLIFPIDSENTTNLQMC